MMNDTVRFVLSLSIVFAVLIGIVRFSKVDRSYYPFLYRTFLVLIVEITARILFHSGEPRNFTVVLNTFSILDFCLFTWMFHNWRLFNGNRTAFLSILGAGFIAWVTITLVVSDLHVPNFLFRMLYSIVLVAFSVNTFNRAVVNDRRNIFRNPKFWICLGIIIFYTFFILVCLVNLQLFKQISTLFRQNLQEINVYSNILANLFYAVAILWIPRKKNFLMPF
ncbi:hypothetical protein HHL16_02015 [Pseudoflavitalea sp. G-6-1-2]|uniref:hypothetical protein n=1 Tax=Pseudoflavitalea sp. G-6-1-2 TaxID=2728841 RepID=UPI00146CF7D8|nr:hypothetical protein [Pseudoflavitalea sp. G-6-1-2]NML19626.1 hypothetical protein [Pseudoflavitalea sp. G-6-1-2]